MCVLLWQRLWSYINGLAKATYLHYWPFSHIHSMCARLSKCANSLGFSCDIDCVCVCLWALCTSVRLYECVCVCARVRVSDSCPDKFNTRNSAILIE